MPLFFYSSVQNIHVLLTNRVDCDIRHHRNSDVCETLEETMLTTELYVNGSRYSLNDAYAARVWPAILFLSLIMLIGSCGNFLVCVVYRCNLKKVNNRFILALAITDLINCLTSVPGEIIDLRFKYSFGESLFCPTMRFFEALSHLSSASILIAIAVDRFRKICKPFERQTTLQAAAAAILTCYVISFCIAFPAVFINGKKTVIVDGVSGADCSIADKYIGTNTPQIYNGVFFLLFTCACVILIVMYILIWRRLRLQRAYRRATEPDVKLRLKFHRDLSSDDILTSSTDQQETAIAGNNENITLQSTKSTEVETDNTRTPKIATISPLAESVTHELESTCPGPAGADTDATESAMPDPNDDTARSTSKSTWTPLHKHGKRLASVRTPPDKTTVMMFLVTLVFICSFLPYIVITTAHAVNKHLFRDLTGVQLAFYNLFLRSHFLNSALNPFIYSFCGQEFRKQLCKVFSRCKTRQ